MIITISILSGLSILTAVALSFYKPKLGIPLLVPAVYLGYYVISTEVPRYFGYPVSINFSGLDQAKFLYGFESKDNIIILIKEIGSDDPRLLKIQPTEANKQALRELNEKAKNGVAAVIKGNGEGKPAGDGTGDIGGELIPDIISIPMDKQEVIRKND